MTKPIEIKPCPFCGYDDVEIDEIDRLVFAVICPECETIGPVIKGPFETCRDALGGPEAAVTKWNLRAGA